MKIVLLAPNIAGKSGWNRYAADLGKALSKQGHTLHAIVQEKTTADWCTQHAILRNPIHYFGNPLLCWWNAKKLQRVLTEIQPDIVHIVAEPYAHLLPFLRMKFPVCMTIHGTYSIVPLKMGRITRRLFIDAYEILDHIFSVSAFTKSNLQEREPELYKALGLEQKIQVVPNGLDLTGIHFHDHPSTHEGHRIMAVGALKPRKGYIKAVEACAAYREKYGKPFVYDIYGSTTQHPAYVARLRKRIADLHLEDVVTLHGLVSDDELRNAFAKSDLFLMLAEREGDYVEGFGLAFLEANARGIPVIGPTMGGCPEAIHEGKSGYVCDPEKSEDVAEKMHLILDTQSIDRRSCRDWAERQAIETRIPELQKGYSRIKKC